MMWAPGKEPEKPFVSEGKCPYFPITLGEQAEDALREWYAASGKSVPQDEVEICRQMDAAELKEHESVNEVTESKPKPVYGTPEFWKDYWARKKAGLVSKKEATEKQKPSGPRSAKSSAPALQS
jgi:hypothetical protein